MDMDKITTLNNDAITLARLLVGKCHEFAVAVKPEASVFEVYGVACNALFESFKEYENKHGIKQLSEVGAIEGETGTPSGSPKISPARIEGRQSESSEGTSENATPEAPRDSAEEHSSSKTETN